MYFILFLWQKKYIMSKYNQTYRFEKNNQTCWSKNKNQTYRFEKNTLNPNWLESSWIDTEIINYKYFNFKIFID